MLRIFIFSLILIQSTLGLTQTKEITKEISSFTLYYNTNEHQLSDESLKTLKDFIGKSVRSKEHKIQIESHTDQVGNATANQILSKKRTAAVKNALIGFGIDSTQISGFAYGENKPLKVGNNENINKENRRSLVRVMTSIPHILLKGTVKPDTVVPSFSPKVVLSYDSFRDSMIIGKDGKFSFYVPSNQKLNISVSAKNFFSQSIDLNIAQGKEPNQQDIVLKYIKLNRTFDLTNITFEGNQPNILPESASSLQNLLETMKTNSDVCFEIGGHVNQPGPILTSGVHFKLAIDRAKTIYNYLSNNGINPKRMHSVGYSNTKMKFPNPKTEAEHQENRRVEIIIRKCDVIGQMKK